MTFKSGREGSVTVNGTPIPMISWRTNPSIEQVTFRNSLTGKFPRREGTFHDNSGTVVMDVDNDANPFAAPISIMPGSIVALNMIPSNGGPPVVVPSALVTSVPFETSVEGKPGLSFDWATNGSYTMGGVTPT